MLRKRIGSTQEQKLGRVIVRGEELLEDNYMGIKVKKGVEKKLVMGVDMGSTQTRVAIINKEGVLSKDFIIPSRVALVDSDVEIIPTSEKLYDNLDSVIQNISQNKIENIFTKQRIVMGTKMINSGLKPFVFKSTVRKRSEKVFYMNIVNSIGYAAVQYYHELGEMPGKISTVIGVSLPPEEILTTDIKELFKSQLIGTYKWSNEDIGVSIEIEIEGLEIETEPVAQIRGLRAESELFDEEQPETILSINMGGRSIGASITIDNISVLPSNKTLKYGGDTFLSKLYHNIVTDRPECSDCSFESIASTIQTGTVRLGNSEFDVVPVIKKTCNEFAVMVWGDVLKNTVDNSGMTVVDIHKIVVSGGPIRRGEYNVSISDYLASEVAKSSMHTEYECVEDNLIPLGLAMVAVSKYPLYLTEENDDMLVYTDRYDEFFDDDGNFIGKDDEELENVERLQGTAVIEEYDEEDEEEDDEDDEK